MELGNMRLRNLDHVHEAWIQNEVLPLTAQ